MRTAVRVLSLLGVLAAFAGIVMGLRRRAASDAALLDPATPAPPVPPVG